MDDVYDEMDKCDTKAAVNFVSEIVGSLSDREILKLQKIIDAEKLKRESLIENINKNEKMKDLLEKINEIFGKKQRYTNRCKTAIASMLKDYNYDEIVDSARTMKSLPFFENPKNKHYLNIETLSRKIDKYYGL